MPFSKNTTECNPLHIRSDVLVCLFLIIAISAVYWQVGNHEFINYDDELYVTGNYDVQKGLTRQNIIWAFTTDKASNWHPLTWLSHMLDCELFGLNPGGHHLTNLFFHLANTLLLFLVLNRMTSSLWRSAFVAALFAVHPLHIESVAWVAERKDVLSTFFWILTMWTYVRYVERPGLGRYSLTLFIFALGLMAKPMLVTLPFVLLLLDHWPLGRLELKQDKVSPNVHTQRTSRPSPQRSSVLWLFLEKTPFFLLSAASSVVTFLVQQHSGAVQSTDAFPVQIRIGNALVSYVSYIGKMLWPQNLAVFYPHPGNDLTMWKPVASAVLLLCISIAVIRAVRRYPYLVVGWLWYLGTLVPVIGLVQVGAQAMADRYTYVPLIGLSIMVSWTIPDLLQHWRYRTIVLYLAAGALLTSLMVSTWMQLRHWKNDFMLFTNALKVTANNHVAHDFVGNALSEMGKIDEAIAHYRKALRMKPSDANLNNNLGVALLKQGNVDEAISHFSAALRYEADSSRAHYNLGAALVRRGQVDEAITHYREAIRLKPKYAEAHNNLGNALIRKGKFDEATVHFYSALGTNANYSETYNNLGVALAHQKRFDEAIDHFVRAIRLNPDYAQARANLQLALEEAGKNAKDSPIEVRR